VLANKAAARKSAKRLLFPQETSNDQTTYELAQAKWQAVDDIVKAKKWVAEGQWQVYSEAARKLEQVKSECTEVQLRVARELERANSRVTKEAEYTRQVSNKLAAQFARAKRKMSGDKQLQAQKDFANKLEQVKSERTEVQLQAARELEQVKLECTEVQLQAARELEQAERWFSQVSEFRKQAHLEADQASRFADFSGFAWVEKWQGTDFAIQIVNQLASKLASWVVDLLANGLQADLRSGLQSPEFISQFVDQFVADGAPISLVQNTEFANQLTTQLVNLLAAGRKPIAEDIEIASQFTNQFVSAVTNWLVADGVAIEVAQDKALNLISSTEIQSHYGYSVLSGIIFGFLRILILVIMLCNPKIAMRIFKFEAFILKKKDYFFSYIYVKIKS